MGGFNETTGSVLRLLEGSKGGMTTEMLRKRLGCSRSNVATILSKLRERGRVTCAWDESGAPVVIRENPPVTRPHRVLVYTITPEGRARLETMKGQED